MIDKQKLPLSLQTVNFYEEINSRMVANKIAEALGWEIYEHNRTFVIFDPEIYSVQTWYNPFGEYNESAVMVRDDYTGIRPEQPAGLTDASYLFNKCKSRTLDLRSWNTRDIKRAYKMFDYAECTNILVDTWDMFSLVDADEMFSNCVNLTHLDTSNWRAPFLQSVKCMFTKTSITKLDLEFIPPRCSAHDVVYDCPSMQEVNIDSRVYAKNCDLPYGVILRDDTYHRLLNIIKDMGQKPYIAVAVREKIDTKATDTQIRNAVTNYINNAQASFNTRRYR